MIWVLNPARPQDYLSLALMSHRTSLKRNIFFALRAFNTIAALLKPRYKAGHILLRG